MVTGGDTIGWRVRLSSALVAAEMVDEWRLLPEEGNRGPVAFPHVINASLLIVSSLPRRRRRSAVGAGGLSLSGAFIPPPPPRSVLSASPPRRRCRLPNTNAVLLLTGTAFPSTEPPSTSCRVATPRSTPPVPPSAPRPGLNSVSHGGSASLLLAPVPRRRRFLALHGVARRCGHFPLAPHYPCRRQRSRWRCSIVIDAAAARSAAAFSCRLRLCSAVSLSCGRRPDFFLCCCPPSGVATFLFRSASPVYTTVLPSAPFLRRCRLICGGTPRSGDAEVLCPSAALDGLRRAFPSGAASFPAA